MIRPRLRPQWVNLFNLPGEHFMAEVDPHSGHDVLIFHMKKWACREQVQHAPITSSMPNSQKRTRP
jgi:hypothetical protein